MVKSFLPCHFIKIKILEEKKLGGEASEILSDYTKETLTSNELSSKSMTLCADNRNCNFNGSPSGS